MSGHPKKLLPIRRLLKPRLKKPLRPKNKMKTDIKKIDSSQVQLTVELSGQELQDHIKKIQQEARQDISVDGFRKGKAPDHMVNDRLDQQKILQFALQDAIQNSLAKVIAENKWDVLH